MIIFSRFSSDQSGFIVTVENLSPLTNYAIVFYGKNIFGKSTGGLLLTANTTSNFSSNILDLL